MGRRTMADPAAVPTVDPIVTLALSFVAGCGALLLQGLLHEFNRWRDRGHQRAVLRTALASELHTALDLLGQTQSVLTRPDGDRDRYYQRRDVAYLTSVYDKTLDRLGLLSSEEARAVVGTYTRLKDRLSYINNSAERANTSPGTEFITLDTANDVVQGISVNLLLTIDDLKATAMILTRGSRRS